MVGQRFFYWLFEQVFPRTCVVCAASGVDICETCLRLAQTQPRWDAFEFGTVWTGFAYEDPIISALIQGWKYRRQRGLSSSLLALTPFPKVDADIVVPVPLHGRRLAERGFNQAEVIAQHFATLSGLPVSRDLTRKRYTKPQAQLDPEARRKNLSGAFMWKGERVRGRVLLIDDVCTTGSTLAECARVLKEAGAKEISAICLARGGH